MLGVDAGESEQVTSSHGCGYAIEAVVDITTGKVQLLPGQALQ